MPLTFLVKTELLLHRPVLIFEHIVKSRASDNQNTRCVRTVLVSWEKCAVTKWRQIYRCLCRGLGGGGSIFCLLNENQTFKCPDT